jgi:hypothetical protein
MNESLQFPDWLPWGLEAFTRARESGKPILLTVGAAWSFGCAEMVRTTYRDPSVVERVRRDFVCVWVDADERPDISERYNLGGWPTTAFLTAGGQMLGGETFTDPVRMTKLLTRVVEAFAARRDELTAPATSPPEPLGVMPADALEPILNPALEPWLVSHLLEAFDDTHGGFGRAAKRVQGAPLFFALAQCRRGDSTLREALTRTLDAIVWGPLFDELGGGVFRYAARRDWTEPSVEKLLSVNATVLRLLLEASVVLDDRRYRDRAKDVLRYAQDVLSNPTTPGFFASQRADDLYYTADATARAQLEPPPVDQSVYSGGNAQMVSSLLCGARLLDDASLLELAVDTLEHVVSDAYRRGEGIAHRIGDVSGARGLLVDQVSVAEALLDAYRATDREVYLDTSQELMLFAMRALWDARAGVFVDRVVMPDDVGLLRRTMTPFAINCRAAGLLARLGRETQRSDFVARAHAALASQTNVARSHSVEAAEYVLALHEVSFSEPS